MPKFSLQKTEIVKVDYKSNLKKESDIEAMGSCSAFERLSLITMVPSLQRAKLISFE